MKINLFFFYLDKHWFDYKYSTIIAISYDVTNVVMETSITVKMPVDACFSCSNLNQIKI